MARSLAEEVLPFVNAGFSGILVTTCEPEQTVEEIGELARREGWGLVLWDCDRGLSWPADPGKPAPEKSQMPLVGIKSLNGVPAENEVPQLLVLANWTRFTDNPVVMQATANAVVRGKARKCFYVVLSPGAALPVELGKLFVVLEHRLPDGAQIRKIATELVVGEDGGDPYAEENAARDVTPEVVEAARGLTRREAEDAFALSLVEHGKLEAEAVWGVKVRSIARSSFMTVHRGGPGFEALGGLENLKGFARLLLRPESPVPAKGLMLLGVPGTGKSAFCKALGAEVGRPVLILDVAACYGKHVGDTEQAIRIALATADAMGKCVVMIDEVEKALSGLGSEGDSGVSSRLFGTVLTWLSDREERGSETFVVATSNDVTKLPPEFARAERFDAMFFLDLPTRPEKDTIWAQYQNAYFGNDWPEPRGIPEDEGWTGAEVRACCRLAKALGVNLVNAAKNVVPVSTTAACKIKELREWASGRALSASYPGVYRHDKSVSESTLSKGRKVNRPLKGDN